MDRSELYRAIEVSVIIVTHNSEEPFALAYAALSRQTIPFQLTIVDSGSAETKYLKHVEGAEVCFMPNIGFSQGNNLGYKALEDSVRYVLFLNPDAILPPAFLEEGVRWLKSHPEAGAFTPLLLGYNIAEDKPTGLIDSTGIFSTWYGKWFDRGQGRLFRGSHFKQEEEVPAISGALMFGRREAFDQARIFKSQVFDERFFCYKEDIDLSIRLKNNGWKLFFVPSLSAFHGRGWRKRREEIPKSLRLMSAANELKLHLKIKNPIKIFYSSLKWVGVKIFNL